MLASFSILNGQSYNNAESEWQLQNNIIGVLFQILFNKHTCWIVRDGNYPMMGDFITKIYNDSKSKLFNEQ